MRLVIQRVLSARVRTAGHAPLSIGPGLVVLVGVAKGDGAGDARWLAARTAGLRLFDDETGRMNRCMDKQRDAILAVSQFTLYGDCRKGRRPSYIEAAAPHEARSLYETYLRALREKGVRVQSGWFGEHMVVSLENDGPVTLIIESSGRAAP